MNDQLLSHDPATDKDLDSAAIGFLRLVGGLGWTVMGWLLYQTARDALVSDVPVPWSIHLVLICSQWLALTQLPKESTFTNIDSWILTTLQRFPICSKPLYVTAWSLCPILQMWRHVSSLPPCPSRSCPLLVLHLPLFLWSAVPLFTLLTVYYAFYLIETDRASLDECL